MKKLYMLVATLLTMGAVTNGALADDSPKNSVSSTEVISEVSSEMSTDVISASTGESSLSLESSYSEFTTGDESSGGPVTSEDTSTNQATNPTTMVDEVAKVDYSAHVQDIGWQGYVSDNQVAGTVGRSLRMEALRINFPVSGISGKIEYSAHVQDIGWQEYVSNNQVAGTVGRSLRMEALKIRLTGDLANRYDIYYRAHIQDKGWLNWAKNDQPVGSSSAGKRMEAIQIKLVPKGEQAPSGEGKSYLVGDEARLPQEIVPSVNYQTHVQNIGWQDKVSNGSIAGTVGQSLRVEALKVSLANARLSGAVEYSAHVQDIGWQGYVSNDNISGTVGRSLRMEALKIRLTGDLANYFDIYYRVHVQDYGWLNWTKNDNPAGTSAMSKRLEALQIVIISKSDQGPPSNGQVAFIAGQAPKDPIVERMKAVPYYYSQRDPRWRYAYVGNYQMGPTGCVPTSLSMILKGSYGTEANPFFVASQMARLGGFNQRYRGASGTDLVLTAQAFGRTVRKADTLDQLNYYLSQGYPVILFQNVGIGHAVVVHGYSNGLTKVYDPYDRMFYPDGWTSTYSLWQNPSNDSLDWDQGRPAFVIM
ncbi:C39 family peptidase [Streptococcaceae bacterium ESL0729]|nr:C39 family peptidase [Streptococcaceae bacterium ESL0729]